MTTSIGFWHRGRWHEVAYNTEPTSMVFVVREGKMWQKYGFDGTQLVALNKMRDTTLRFVSASETPPSLVALLCILQVSPLHRWPQQIPCQLFDGLDEITLVVRMLRPAQFAESYLLPADALKNYTVEGHVLHGSRQHSNWFSAVNICNPWGMEALSHMLRVYALGGPNYVDPSTGRVRVVMFPLGDVRGCAKVAETHCKGVTAKNFAHKVNEVAICGCVDRLAMVGEWDETPALLVDRFADWWHEIVQAASRFFQQLRLRRLIAAQLDHVNEKEWLMRCAIETLAEVIFKEVVALHTVAKAALDKRRPL